MTAIWSVISLLKIMTASTAWPISFNCIVFFRLVQFYIYTLQRLIYNKKKKKTLWYLQWNASMLRMLCWKTHESLLINLILWLYYCLLVIHFSGKHSSIFFFLCFESEKYRCCWLTWLNNAVWGYPSFQVEHITTPNK